MNLFNAAINKEKYNIFIILFILISLPLILFWQTTGFELLWDDEINLMGNPYLRPPSLQNLLHFWTANYEGLYIPVAYSLWGVLGNLGNLTSIKPDDGFIFHLANVVLHILNGCAVYILLRQILKKIWLPLLGALLFLAHPIQVEAVGWASEFRGLVSAFFGFYSLIFYIKYCQFKYVTPNTRQQYIYSIISLFLFLLALLSKPSAVVFLFFAVFIEYYLHKPSVKQMIQGLAFWFIAVATISIITSLIQESHQTYPFWAKPLVWSDAILFYCYKIIFPFSLSPSYARTPDFVMGQWWFYVLWLIPVLTGWYLWKIRVQKPIVILSVLLFITGFLPVSGLKEFTFQDWSTVTDRYLYLSMFGVSLCFSYFSGFANQWWQKCVIYSMIIVCIVWTAFVQVPIWGNSIALWTHCIKITPKEHRAYHNRGMAYQAVNNSKKALLDYNSAIAINPKNARVYNNRGNLYSSQKEYKKALSDYNKAIKINPDFSTAYNNRGNFYMENKEYEKALIDYNKAIKINPDIPGAFYNRGNIYKEKQNFDKALLDYKQSIALNPYYIKSYNNIGIVYYLQKEYNKALLAYNTAIEINPELPKSYNNRGDIYKAKNDFKNALLDYSKAISLNSKFSVAYNNRGNIYKVKKDYTKALLDYTKAVEIDPDFAKAYNNRGNLYKSQKKYKKAMDDYNKAIAIDPEPAKPYYNRGIVHHLEKRYQEALMDYNSAIKKDPVYAMAYNNRGVLYKEVKLYDLALADYNEALNINRENTKALMNRAMLQYIKRDFSMALLDLKRALNLGDKAALPLIEFVKNGFKNQKQEKQK